MPIIANAIRVGNIINHENKLWVVLKTMHTQPGKGGAYMQVEMKNIKTGTKTNIRFRSGESIDKVALEEKKFTVLFVSGKNITVMNMENYDQLDLNIDLIEESQRAFVADNMQIIVEYYDDMPVIVKLPNTVVMSIKECEMAIKGQTAASSYKPAILENGVRIMVPPFIEIGEKIVVKIENCEYVERAK